MTAKRALLNLRALSAILLVATLCLALVSCAGDSAPESPYDMYRRIYDAIDPDVKNATPYITRVEGGQDIAYLRLLVKDANAAQVEKIADAINEVAENETIELFVTNMDLSGLKSVKCQGLICDLGEGIQLEDLASVPALIELRISTGHIENGEALPFMPMLKTLVISSDRGLFDLEPFKNCTSVEHLTLSVYNTLHRVASLEALQAMSNLKSVRLEFYKVPGEPKTFPAEIEFVEALKALPGLETINGVDAKMYDVFTDMDEDAWNEFQAEKTEEMANTFLRDIHERYENEEYATVKDASVTGKVMIITQAVYSNSINSAIHGEDYQGIPTDKLTADPEQCTEVIIVYSTSEYAGSYTNGASGYDVLTWLRVVHVGSQTMSEPIYIITDRAPPEVAVNNNDKVSMFTSYSGEISIEKAVERIMKMLP